jgi:hypothetical protein
MGECSEKERFWYTRQITCYKEVGCLYSRAAEKGSYRELGGLGQSVQTLASSQDLGLNYSLLREERRHHQQEMSR